MPSYPVDLPVKKHGFLKKMERIAKGECFYHQYFDDNRCIFIHIPKAAGTSIGQALFGDGRPGHRLAMDYYLESSKKFTRYFSFSFVRNPYDRLFSAYHYLMHGGKTQRDRHFRDQHLLAFPNFESFVMQGLRQPEIMSWIHFRPQFQFLVDFQGKLIVNFVGRYENLQQDFATIADRLQRNVSLPHSNATNHEHRHHTWKNHYTTDMLKMVEQVYTRDFELFDYPLLSIEAHIPAS